MSASPRMLPGRQLQMMAGRGRPMREMIDVVIQQAPQVWSLFYPRIYRDSDRYCSPKIPAAAMTSAVDMALTPGGMKISRPVQWIFLAADKITQYDVPFLFIAPELLDAAMRSNPPENTKWTELKLPYEGAVFMLPKGSFKDSEGKSYDFVGYCRRRPGDKVGSKFASLSNVRFADVTESCFVAFTMASDGEGFLLECALNEDMTQYIEVGDVENMIPKNKFELELSTSESELVSKLMNIVFRVSLALEARPSLLSPGSFEKNHKKDQNLEIWTPTIIGRDYRYQRTELMGGTHVSPRMHWRRGHFRRQAVGPRSATSHKTIWLEPMLVGN